MLTTMYTLGQKFSDFIFVHVKSSNKMYGSLQKLANCNIISFQQIVKLLNVSVHALR